MKQKIVSIVLALTLCLSLTATAFAAPFTDVASDASYAAAVDYVTENGLMDAAGDGTFDPNGILSRAVLAQSLYRAAGEPAVTGSVSFKDADGGAWYAKAIAWAGEKGILSGYGNGKVGPDDPITREQMAVVLYRYEQAQGGGFTGNWAFPLDFSDKDQVSAWAYEAMCWVTMSGVVSGRDNGTLDPQGHITRAEAAEMLTRFCTKAAETTAGTKIKYRFADGEEGVARFLANSAYYEGFSQHDLDYRMQKKGATLEEWLAFATTQISGFTEEEKQLIGQSIDRVEATLDAKGFALPEFDEIVFIRATMEEEPGAAAYTHGYQVYLGDYWLGLLASGIESAVRYADSLMCHEIFHCLTRNQFQFKKDMYSIIHFTVQEKDFEIRPAIRESFFSNPDVEHHNSHAVFTINGEKKDCFVVYIMTKPFETEGDIFIENGTTGLIPIDDLDTLYTMDDAEDFFEVFGENTGYVIDPEECMADNFSYAIMYEDTGVQGETFPTPEILEAIRDYLKK